MLRIHVEATRGTAEFLRANGIRTRLLRKLSEGSNEIIDSLRQGHVNYVINTMELSADSFSPRRLSHKACGRHSNITVFHIAETVEVLLDVLEDITMKVSTIDEEALIQKCR